MHKQGVPQCNNLSVALWLSLLLHHVAMTSHLPCGSGFATNISSLALHYYALLFLCSVELACITAIFLCVSASVFAPQHNILPDPGRVPFHKAKEKASQHKVLHCKVDGRIAAM